MQLDAGHEIVAYTAGKMKKNRIKTLAGDRVTIEMSFIKFRARRMLSNRHAPSANDRRHSRRAGVLRHLGLR